MAGSASIGWAADTKPFRRLLPSSRLYRRQTVSDEHRGTRSPHPPKPRFHCDWPRSPLATLEGKQGAGYQPEARHARLHRKPVDWLGAGRLWGLPRPRPERAPTTLLWFPARSLRCARNAGGVRSRFRQELRPPPRSTRRTGCSPVEVCEKARMPARPNRPAETLPDMPFPVLLGADPDISERTRRVWPKAVGGIIPVLRDRFPEAAVRVVPQRDPCHDGRDRTSGCAP